MIVGVFLRPYGSFALMMSVDKADNEGVIGETNPPVRGDSATSNDPSVRLHPC